MQRLAELLPTGPADDWTHRGARRRDTRYPVHASVRVLDVGIAGVVLNASAGGLRVALDGMVREGDALALELDFPSRGAEAKTGCERAEVVWARTLPDGCLAGLRFV